MANNDSVAQISSQPAYAPAAGIHDYARAHGRVIACPRRRRIPPTEASAVPCPHGSSSEAPTQAIKNHLDTYRSNVEWSSSDIEDFFRVASQHSENLRLNMPPHSGQNQEVEVPIRPQHEPQSIEKETGQLYTLEEWDNKFPVHKPETAASTSSKVPTIVPLPAVPTTGENVAQFNHLCQLHSIIPTYTIREVSQGCFSAKVEFGGDICEDPGPFPSKKQARDVVCRQACEVLENLEAPTKGKRKSRDDEAAKLQEENWVSQLMEFSQKHKHAMPAYKDYESVDLESQKMGLITGSKQFACTVQIQAAPGQVFGSEERLFPGKGPAKRNAAKEAILWLRANGKSPIASDAKRRKSSEEHDAMRLTQGLMKLNTNQSLAQMVHERSNQLGFSQPAFELRPATPPPGAVAPNFYTACACYRDQDVAKEPRLQGHLCASGPVFGQKRAREECCRLLLAMLEELVDERLNAMQE